MSDDVRAWLDHTQKLDQAATPGPWVWSEPDPEWTGDYYGVWERDEDMPPVAATHAPGEYGKADAEWIAHARTALPAAVAALRAVADLHQPDDGGHCTECLIGHDGDSFTAGNPVYDAWPCATITAIQDTLGDHQ